MGKRTGMTVDRAVAALFLAAGLLSCAHPAAKVDDSVPPVQGAMQPTDPVFLNNNEGSGKTCSGDSDCALGEMCFPENDRCILSYPNPRLLDISLTDMTTTQTTTPCKLATLYFPYDSTELVEEAGRWLDYDVRCIKARNAKELVLGGHADSRGPRAYNQKLSIDRAEAVRDRLTKAGLSIPIKIEGYGERAPLRPGKSEKDYAYNRRVVFSIP